VAMLLCSGTAASGAEDAQALLAAVALDLAATRNLAISSTPPLPPGPRANLGQLSIKREIGMYIHICTDKAN